MEQLFGYIARKKLLLITQFLMVAKLSNYDSISYFYASETNVFTSIKLHINLAQNG